MKEPFQFQVKGKEVLGIIHYDKKMLDLNHEVTCIIMCYGFNGDRVDQHRILFNFAQFSVSKGLICVRFDYRNQGLSDGMFMEVRLGEKSEDIISIIEWVKNKFHDKEVRICLLGFSDGAKTVMETYRNSQQYIDQIILWNPVLSISKEENTKRNHHKMLEKEKMILHPDTRKPVIKFLGLWVHPSLMRDILNDRYINELIACSLPVGILWGECDLKTVDVRNEINNYALPTTFKQQTIAQADHLFSDDNLKVKLFNATLGMINKG